jgi:hypothetical protein
LGFYAALLAGESGKTVHPVVWGEDGMDADALLKSILEESGEPVSRYIVDDLPIASGVSHGCPVAYTTDDGGLLIIGRDEGDILAHRRLIQNGDSPDPPSPEIICAVHLLPAALVETTDSVDALASLLSGCGFPKINSIDSGSHPYREMTDALSTWKTADAVVWTDDGQTNLTVILSRNQTEP